MKHFVTASVLVVVFAGVGVAELRRAHSNPPLADPEVPSWPPSLPQVSADAVPKDGVKLEFQNTEHPSIVMRYDAAHKQGYHFFLLTLHYFNGQKFVGTHQRFEEQSSAGVSTYNLPPTPKDADTVVASLRTCPIDEDDFKNRKSSAELYRHTWGHFTTAELIHDRWTFQTWIRPLDTDLQAWLADHEIKVGQGVSATQKFQLPTK